MGSEEMVKFTLHYIEARFLCSFLIEKHDDLQGMEQTPLIEEQISFVKRIHNKLMKTLEDD